MSSKWNREDPDCDPEASPRAGRWAGGEPKQQTAVIAVRTATQVMIFIEEYYAQRVVGIARGKNAPNAPAPTKG